MRYCIAGLLTAFSLTANAGIWCLMDNISAVDTVGNQGDSCFVSGYFDINGTAVFKEDIHLCAGPSPGANSRNLSIALTAFTADKKLAFYFADYSQCDQIKSRWETGAGRVSIRK